MVAGGGGGDLETQELSEEHLLPLENFTHRHEADLL